MATDSERLSTGIPDLDTILGGGLDPGSTVAIAGVPGSGKTVLAQQICFHLATAEHPALYYTTWSEPHTKLIRHLRQFEYFEESAIGVRVHLLHLPSIGSGPDAGAAITAELAATALQRQPSVVVVDSSKALHGLLDRERHRQTVWDLSSRVAHSGAVLLLVGEYTEAEIDTEPEFAVADGILRLSNEAWELTDRRHLRVLKMRGAAPLPGVHSMRISSRGISAFPRAETLVAAEVAEATGERAPFAQPELDEIVGGGIPRGDVALLLGPSGAGKTVLGLSWVAAGLAAGERCLITTLQESASELALKARALGWPIIAEALDDGRLRIRHISPSELDLDETAVILRDDLAVHRPSRVVIDSIAELDLSGRSASGYVTYLRSVAQLVRLSGATGLMTSEIATFGPDTPIHRGLSFVFQDVLVLRFLEGRDEVLRALSVFKMRTSRHALHLTGLAITERGLEVRGRVDGVSGMLGWSALRTRGSEDL